MSRFASKRSRWRGDNERIDLPRRPQVVLQAKISPKTKENQMEPVPTNRDENRLSKPQIVSREEWQRARDQLLVKEKAATRASDALAAERRRLPMVRIEKDYVFDGPDGKVGLLDLFEGRRQLIIYHFMFAPGVDGWPS